MDHIINRIVEIEKSAAALLNEALEIKENLCKSIENDVEALRADYLKKSNARVLKVSQLESDFTSEALSDIAAQTDTKLLQMQNNYDENCKLWVDTLYNNIIND